MKVSYAGPLVITIALLWCVMFFPISIHAQTQPSCTDTYNVPHLTNAPNYLPIDVKYKNTVYPNGNSAYEAYQAVHPDIVYVPTGWNGYKYWLSVSPFPNDIAKYEDPNVFVSNDGTNWVSPRTNSNVVPLVDPSLFEYSDADMSLINGTMYLYYRLNDKKGTESYDDDVATLYRISSVDGRNWTDPQSTTMSVVPSGRFASPAILYENGAWTLFYIDTLQGETVVRKRTSTDGVNWTGDSLVFPMPTAWHVDVMKYQNNYLMFLNETRSTGLSAKLYYYTSTDKINWTQRGVLLEPSVSGGWDSSSIYRSTAIIDGTRFRLWYSAFKDHVVHTGYTEDSSWSYAQSCACNRCSVQNGCERTQFQAPNDSCTQPITGSNVTRTTDCSCPQISGGNNTRCVSCPTPIPPTPIPPTPPVTPSCTGAGPPGNPTIPYSQPTYDVYATGVTDATEVLFPTWSAANGQDDLVWYSGTNLGGDTWGATIPFADHPDDGQFYVHVYLRNSAGQIICGTANFIRATTTPILTPIQTPTTPPASKPGDLNGDGKVDIYDYNILVADFGKTGEPGWIPADIINDGKVDIFDYNVLVGNFGT